MGVNLDKPLHWKADIVASVDMYNNWFMKFAPKAYRETRTKTTKTVEDTLYYTKNLTQIDAQMLRENPGVLSTLRMATCPPIAKDRLVGLAGVNKNLVECMESGTLPRRTPQEILDHELEKITDIITQMADPDIFVWLDRSPPREEEIHRAATIIADRLCGSVANPIIRNAQEQRQLAQIENWLTAQQYQRVVDGTRFNAMPPGSFGFHMNVQVKSRINIPIDGVIMRHNSLPGQLPLLIEAKSAGDYINPNKRRKEEATKMAQLRATFGPQLEFILFLCGYFDSAYLGYEAAEGMDWVWEHRIDDLTAFGV